MNSNKPYTEILAHITAPSRGADDSAYRGLASAYLSFEPSVRTELGTLFYNASQHEEAGHLESTQSRLPSSSSASAFISPDLSFRSAAHNLGSPDLRRSQVGTVREVVDSQPSWRAPPSVIADSNPENNVTIARYCSPTRILEHHLQGFDSSQSNGSQVFPRDTGPVTSPSRNSEIVTATRSNGSILPPQTAAEDPTSHVAVIPQSPSVLSQERTGPRAVVSCAEEEMVSSSISRASFSSVLETKLPSRAGSEPLPPLKRLRRLTGRDYGKCLSRTTSDIGPRQDEVKEAQLGRRLRAHQTADGLEIHSPEPPVGCRDLDVSDIVTQKLQKLARDIDIKKEFQPKDQKRQLRPFERGYWYVDCSAWPDNIKRDTWGFLANYVGNGDAGWGIRCRRDKDYGWIRLYCWGCIAGHMHLLLYLASRRQLNYTGSTWVAGDGEVVIIMEPKYPQTGLG